MAQSFFLLIVVVLIIFFKRWDFERRRKLRRDYYRNEYLKSDEWKRKRYVVLKRDNRQCVYCGRRATQVHHKNMQSGTLEKNQLIGLFQYANLVMTLNINKPAHNMGFCASGARRCYFSYLQASASVPV